MKKEKGITLVALIITIIVMLILVAVSVSIIINSGLVGKAKDGAERYKESAEKEGNITTVNIVENGVERTVTIDELTNIN